MAAKMKLVAKKECLLLFVAKSEQQPLVIKSFNPWPWQTWPLSKAVSQRLTSTFLTMGSSVPDN